MTMPLGVEKLAGMNRTALLFVGLALYLAAVNDVPVTVTSGKRTREEQDALYQAYLAGRSKYPAAPPGHSAHEAGLAWDSWVPDGFWGRWNEIRSLVGWKLLPSDQVHAEVPNWRDWPTEA